MSYHALVSGLLHGPGLYWQSHSLMAAVGSIHSLLDGWSVEVSLQVCLDIGTDISVLDTGPLVPLKPWVGVEIGETVLTSSVADEPRPEQRGKRSWTSVDFKVHRSQCQMYVPVSSLQSSLEDRVKSDRLIEITLLAIRDVLGGISGEVVGLALHGTDPAVNEEHP